MSAQNEAKSVWGGVAVIIVFLLAVVVWPNWYDSKHPQPTNECRMVTRKVQTIKKIDGSVDSNETELVYGCEYEDGSFLEAPDSDK